MHCSPPLHTQQSQIGNQSRNSSGSAPELLKSRSCTKWKVSRYISYHNHMYRDTYRIMKMCIVTSLISRGLRFFASTILGGGAYNIVTMTSNGPCYAGGIQGGGLAPPPPHKKLLPQIVRRGSRGAKRALPPPLYKILDPPMLWLCERL